MAAVDADMEGELSFGSDLIDSLNEALLFAEGKGDGIVHVRANAREARERAGLEPAEMAQLMGLPVTAWLAKETAEKPLQGPEAVLALVIARDAGVVRSALGLLA